MNIRTASLTAFFALNMAVCSAKNVEEDPGIQSYSLDFELKLLSDRRNGLSDTYRKPGAEFSILAAHESGFVAQVQLANVALESFPNGQQWMGLAALGYRWGSPDTWHFGAGVATERFPGAYVEAPKASPFDSETIKTKFDTSYVLFEFGYSLIEGRYLYVLSRDFRGNNTAVVCGSAAQVGIIQGDPNIVQAMSCYDRGFHHSRGSQILQIAASYPIDNVTKAVAQLGYVSIRNMSFLNTFDYKIGLNRKQWGLDFEVNAVGAQMRNNFYTLSANTQGTSVKRLDRTALVFSVAKKF